MKATVVEEAHNRVVWETKSSILWTEIGIIVAGGCVSALLAMTPSPLRWTLVAVIWALVLGIGVVLGLTTPLMERGELERTLDGGTVRRSKRWLITGQRVTWEGPLESVTRFRLEPRTFEETGDRTYALARLVAIAGAEAAPLTDWLDDAFVLALGESLAKAGRCEFEAA